jgi:dihydrodipicolinate synthase/N-acetylneuraminate lyase
MENRRGGDCKGGISPEAVKTYSPAQVVEIMSYISSALGTPLTESESLHQSGLAAHIEAQKRAGIDGLLVAGSMGVMPLLSTTTYCELVRVCAQEWQQGELLVGVGDLSLARTKDRLAMLDEFKVDGVVVMAPYFMKFSTPELVDYFTFVANVSRRPVYLYDLPQRTGVALSVETVLRLSEHPNIVGIKCSGDVAQIRRLVDSLNGANFRVIIAHPMLIDVLLRSGFNEHVDGIFSIAPQLARQIECEACVGNWEGAALKTRLLNDLLMTVVSYGVFPAMTELLNWQSVPGNFAPMPSSKLTPESRERLLAEPAVVAVQAVGGF